ncbi:MAG TPA: hypothetical protein VMS31_13125 [Pyrinomonadaceae bacterium]|nr:hypothetical protein [Pyrinomonadaceae bacterium]
MNGIPEGCPRSLPTVPGGEINSIVSGGLRYAATTGYYLTALQAEPGTTGPENFRPN